MIQDVFILGATGKVGRTLVSQIFENGDTNYLIHENPTRIVGIASSTRFIYNFEKGISLESTMRFNNGSAGVSIKGLRDIFSAFREYRSDLGKQLTVVDATGCANEMIDLHLRIIEGTEHGIVTANKNPLVECNFFVFQRLTRQIKRYGYRCSVMAGAEAVNKVRDLKDLGEKNIEISGCFSGTLGYLTSELEKGRKFSDIIEEARASGYTEPDPAEDLSGRDVAKKILILARTAGYDIKPGEFKLEPFVPEIYLTEGSDYMDLDDLYKRRTEEALEKGNVLRYIARFGLDGVRSRIDVGLKEVPLESEFGILRGTRNKIVVKTSLYSPSFYSVEAPGAGLEVTAQNIRRDLLDRIQNRIVNYKF